MFDDQPTTKPNTPPGNLPVEPEDMFAGLDEGEAKVTALGAQKGPDALEAGKLKPVAPAAPITPEIKVSPLIPLKDNTGELGQVSADSGATAGGVDYNMRAPVVGKIVMVILGVAVLGGLAYGGWVLYNKKFIAGGELANNAPVATNFKSPDEATAPATAPVVEAPASEIIGTTTVNTIITSTQTLVGVKNDNILFGEPIDTDKDGLDDVSEKKLGANINIPDTDRDGLLDGEEAHIYKTDPLKLDTDADRLSDGSEIKMWLTDPLNSDSDGDGYADGQEVYNGFNPMGPGKLLRLPEGVTTSTIRKFVLPAIISK